MTTIVKAKPLSQLRREEKQRKLTKKAKIVDKVLANKAKADQLEARVKLTRDNVTEMINKIQPLPSQQPKKELPLEEHFVKSVQDLDKTLTDIVIAVQNMGHLRASLNWDHVKAKFDETEVSNIDTKLELLESKNKAYNDQLSDLVTKAGVELEDQKQEPTREGIDGFVLMTSTKAFEIFALWNEEVMVIFHDIHDAIDELKEAGETQ